MATSPRPIVPDPVAARPVQLDQVDHLLKLQKWAQKISSILDLDELIHKIVDDVAASILLRGNQHLFARPGAGRIGDGRRPRLHRSRQGFKAEGGQGRHGGLRCRYPADALCARCAPGPVLHRVRGVDALRGGHSLIGGWSAGGRVCGFASRTGRLSPASICAGCRVCAITLRSLFTMRGAFSMNGTSASA